MSRRGRLDACLAAFDFDVHEIQTRETVFKKRVDLRTGQPVLGGGRGSTIVRSGVAPCEEAASLLRISNGSCLCGDLGGRRGGAVKGIG